jgi:hypothetical protein
MFGEGVSIPDLIQLLNAVRKKDLVLQSKILDGPWETLTGVQVKAMLAAVTQGKVEGPQDIRLRLFSKSSQSPTFPTAS